MKNLEKLYESLQYRMRPEDIADMVLDTIAIDLNREERAILRRAASGSLKRGMHNLTSMAQDFFRPVAPQKQVEKALELFNTVRKGKINYNDVNAVESLIGLISLEIRKTVGESDFMHDRLNRESRRDNNLDISKRRYNKLFRFLSRFETKVKKYVHEQRKYEASRIAKSGLATKITKRDFMKSRYAACFIAYFVARSNRRSQFTNTSQDKAFDNIGKMLLDKFKKEPCQAGWRAIAHVMPDYEIVSKLSKKSKVNLYAMWMSVLRDIAELLGQTYNGFNRRTMIVKSGDDSSTWNALAGAWNSARRGWMGLVYALGMEDTLNKVCFGKVMRLMAADVAYWHQSSGGELEPDTLVWAELPAPWEVFSGTKACNKSMIESICKKHNVDPEKKGWTMAVSGRKAVTFKPTPELVHGVTVSHPELASILKKAGWFSGKAKKNNVTVPENVDVERDVCGMALAATLK